MVFVKHNIDICIAYLQW